MKKLNLLSLLPVMLFPLLIAGNAHAARPYSGFLPAAVNNKSGNIFWCDAHRQVRKLCTATEVDSMGWFIVVRSKPSRDCPGGWIACALITAAASGAFTHSAIAAHLWLRSLTVRNGRCSTR